MRSRGFSLIEMMVVLAVITIIMGAVFRSINLAQRTSTSQQMKLDLTQQARQFVDQLTLDLRNAGYPNQRNLTKVTDPCTAGGPVFVSPASTYNAPGLLYVDAGSLWFAGDLDGTSSTTCAGAASVRIVRYDYYATGTNCPCLRRTEFPRNGGDPLTDAQTPGTAAAQLEIQGVQNANIFTVFDDTGTPLPLPLDIDSEATQIANINSIQVLLSVKSVTRDFTGAYPTTTVASSIALNNCSDAMGNGQTPAYCN
jgi:prepilin-type N-terminal cleavage/methylation domain-containing protein